MLIFLICTFLPFAAATRMQMSIDPVTDYPIRREEIARLNAEIKRKRVISYIHSVIALAALSLAAIPLPFMPIIAIFITSVVFMGEMHVRHSYSKQLENLTKGVEDEALINAMISHGSPYVLYLRDFDSETDTTDVLSVDGAWGRVHRPREYIQRDVLEPINRHLPVFGFLNYRSVMWKSIGYRINAVGADWFSLFERYAASAALIIFDIKRRSEGLVRELDWAREHCHRVNIVVFVADGRYGQFRQLDMHVISGASWRIGVPLPEGLLQYLDGLSSNDPERIKDQ